LVPAVTSTVTVHVPAIPLLLAGIDLVPGKVTVEPPALAKTPPVPLQVVPAFGVLAIFTPVGKMSINAALKVATFVLGLDSVMVRVDTPPVLIVAGLKPLPSVGAEASGTLHMDGLITLLSIVTATLRAKALPDTVAPVFSVMLSSASMFPTKLVVVPIVAELPTCQNTLQSWPPLITTTEELEPVVSVLPIWKTQTALGSPPALRVSTPEFSTDDE
jgi:hypothetical protein